MKMSKMRFLSGLLVSCACCMTGAYAAPTVKMLGTNNARVGTNAAVVKPTIQTVTNSSDPQRLGSVRAQNLVGGNTNTLTTTSSVSGTNRLGLGKYINSSVVSTGNVKPGIAKIPVSPNTDLTGYSDRISDLETEMDLKQNKISVGDGLVLENNTISFNTEYSQIPEQIESLQDSLDEKLSESDLANYYTKTEVIQAINAHSAEAADTIYNAGTGNRIYVTVSGDFDESIFDN